MAKSKKDRRGDEFSEAQMAGCHSGLRLLAKMIARCYINDRSSGQLPSDAILTLGPSKEMTKESRAED